MKIGVITHWNSLDNYGQVLQCFALQKYLESLGYEVYLIKYTPKKNDDLWKKIKRNFSLKRIYYLFSSEHRIMRLKYKQMRETEQIVKKLALNRKFDLFREKNIKSTQNTYRSINELRKNPPEADIYICGSDQVWNNSLSEKNTAAWFLDFGIARKISYAASIGRRIQPKEISRFKKYLEKFDKISVREKSSQEFLNSIGITNVYVTIDPTLLLKRKDYNEIMEFPYKTDGQYILIYIINVNKKEDIYWNVLLEYQKKNKLKVKIVCSSGYIPACLIVPEYENEQLTIGQWLGAVNNCKCFITTSFHGVVFSIILHKPFLVIPLIGEYQKANDRIYTLLELLGLKERIYRPEILLEQQMDAMIDWMQVENKLKELRLISEEFLRNL